MERVKNVNGPMALRLSAIGQGNTAALMRRNAI